VIDPVIDRIDSFALRHRRLLAIVGVVWLVISWASSAGFIPLPQIPLLTGKTGVFASSAFAAFWWAWMNPRVVKRRSAREAAKTALEDAR
jgi:Na+/proline symporter